MEAQLGGRFGCHHIVSDGDDVDQCGMHAKCVPQGISVIISESDLTFYVDDEKVRRPLTVYSGHMYRWQVLPMICVRWCGRGLTAAWVSQPVRSRSSPGVLYPARL